MKKTLAAVLAAMMALSTATVALAEDTDVTGDIDTLGKLEEVETVLTSTRYAEWLMSPRSEAFDFAHYKEIHRFLFSDLYEWAGQVRSVNISKKGTMFIPAENIETQAQLIFHRLQKQNCFRGFSRNDFIEEIVDFYCITNDLHPFREGNGRTQRVFLTQLIRFAGYRINFSEIDTELLMIATIHASHGVTDLLKQIFRESIL